MKFITTQLSHGRKMIRSFSTESAHTRLWRTYSEGLLFPLAYTQNQEFSGDFRHYSDAEIFALGGKKKLTCHSTSHRILKDLSYERTTWAAICTVV